VEPVRQVSVQETVAALAAGVPVVDVREADEWAAGRVEGTQHLPMSELAARVGELPDAPEIYFICRSGGRSDNIAHALAHHGRAGCANVVGGIRAWAAAGLPLVPEGGKVL
jgi:rhodanese-related sulfurtransferase